MCVHTYTDRYTYIYTHKFTYVMYTHTQGYTKKCRPLGPYRCWPRRWPWAEKPNSGPHHTWLPIVSMDFYGFLWVSMDFYGFLLISMDFYGFSMDFYGILWISMDFYGFSMDFLWISMDFYGFLWIFYGFSMDFYGFLWFMVDITIVFMGVTRPGERLHFAMERSTMFFMGKITTISTGPFSIAFCMFTRGYTPSSNYRHISYKPELVEL